MTEEELNELLDKGIRQAKEGRTIDRGSFEEYLEDDEE